ncbi:protein of unknown function [Streptococcus thermophilus]|nr:protein of unknown function [Streptococcus thermophilus]CAD0131840.1 protein of unknown function [Streptococcus thermophilus]CAD0155042.1 protein of unknown function [Streptococcus thermophilus]
MQDKNGLFNIGGLILISLVFFFISLKLWDRDWMPIKVLVRKR